MKLQKRRNNISCSCYFLSVPHFSPHWRFPKWIAGMNETVTKSMAIVCLCIGLSVCARGYLFDCVCVGLAFDYKNRGVTNPIIRSMCVEGAIHWMDKTNDVCIKLLTQWVYSPNDRTLTDIIANNCSGFTVVKREKLRWAKMNGAHKGVHTA